MRWQVAGGDPYALLSDLLAREEGIFPLPLIARRERGKPWFPGHPRLHFSLSHSGDLALCALGKKALGADIEVVRPRSAGLPRYTLSGREYVWYEMRGSRWEDFYTLWTLKEARVKCTGEGLSPATVRNIEVPLLAPGEVGELGGFRFAALAGEGWRGAVCEKNS